MASPPSGTPQRKPRRRWRWHVPPALMHGPETLEGGEILEEMTGAAALVLWESVRDVSLWGSVHAPEERAGLFHEGAYEKRLREIGGSGLDAALEPPLKAIAALLRDPTGASEADVTSACRAASEWANGQELVGTALAFAQAGAIASPANAGAGLRVGQLARSRGEYARAESWFRRVIGLGRQAKDWQSYAEAFMGLGNLYIMRGNYPAARRFHIRGLRAARRHGMREIQGRALHDLFVISAQTGSVAEAHEFARAAHRAYGPSHPRVPALAADLAYFWLLRGRFAPALEVFRGVQPHLTEASDRMQVWGNIARAAGAADDRASFEQAWDELYSSAGDWHSKPNAAQALLDVARGAASLREWARAERAAGTARDIAQRMGLHAVLAETESVLDSVARKRGMEAATAAPNGDDEAAVLAGDFVRSLAGAGR